MAKTDKETMKPDISLPDMISKEDALTLELAAVYVNSAKLQLQIAEEASAKAQSEMARKYQLGQNDRIDLRALTITRH